jgi:nicotinic acid mononucleotide adenylyltransferase
MTVGEPPIVQELERPGKSYSIETIEHFDAVSHLSSAAA